MPGSYETDGGDDHAVEDGADDNGHPDGTEEAAGAEFWAGFLGGFSYRFESCHEIRNDLDNKKNGYKRSVREQWGKVAPRSAARTQGYEEDEECQSAEARPILKRRAQPNAAVVKDGEERGKNEANDQMGKKYGTAGDAIEFHGVERGEDVASDTADGYSLPRTDDEVGEGHHPSRGEADGAGKNRRGVGDFASGVGHRHHQLAVDPTDGK